MIKHFKPEYLIRKLKLPGRSIEDRLVYQEYDYELREIVFENLDGKYYKTRYIKTRDSISLRQKGNRVICFEVIPEKITITHWREI